MPHPPDPQMRRGAVGSGTPRVAKSSCKQSPKTAPTLDQDRFTRAVCVEAP